MDCLAGYLCRFAGGVLNGSHQLVAGTLSCEFIVPSRPTEALFDFTGETAAGPGHPMLRGP